MTRVLRPLTDDKWGKLREKIREQDVQDQNATPRTNAARQDQVSSEATSINDITQALKDDHGVLLDANREVRIKLYIGQVTLFPSLTPLYSPFKSQVFLGWFWFIPTFHMPQRTPGGSTQSTTLVLTRKELDFPIGIGANIIDVAVTLEWVPVPADVLDPPSREGSLASCKGSNEPSTLPAVLQAVGDPVAGMVDAKQAADD